MCDFTGDNCINLADCCPRVTGGTEYGDSYKQWCNPTASSKRSCFLSRCLPTIPKFKTPQDDCCWRNHSFAKGPRFGVPPCCDCTPPPERVQFATTYQNDYYEMPHNFNHCNVEDSALPGVKPPITTVTNCPFTKESTFNVMPCMGSGRGFPGPSSNDPFKDLRIDAECQKPCGPKLRKDELIKPGTDTVQCPACPFPCSSLPNCCMGDSRVCNSCCAEEYPCKLHMATTTPSRKYPIIMSAPRFFHDPSIPISPPKDLLCGGGTSRCPMQNEFPTKRAVAQAQKRLLAKLEQERCLCPPECVESIYRASYKVPPVKNIAADYCCPPELICKARQIDNMIACKGTPPPCIPIYCLDGGHPGDCKPMFDHDSTYNTDFAWNWCQRYKPYGGEMIQRKPDAGPPAHAPCPCPIAIPCPSFNSCFERTEEKERWGGNWECCPPYPCDPCAQKCG